MYALACARPRLCSSLRDEHEPRHGQSARIQALPIWVPGSQYGCWNVTVSPVCLRSTNGTGEPKELVIRKEIRHGDVAVTSAARLRYRRSGAMCSCAIGGQKRMRVAEHLVGIVAQQWSGSMQVPGCRHPGMVHRTKRWAREVSREPATKRTRWGVLGTALLAWICMAASVLGCCPATHPWLTVDRPSSTEQGHWHGGIVPHGMHTGGPCCPVVEMEQAAAACRRCALCQTEHGAPTAKEDDAGCKSNRRQRLLFFGGLACVGRWRAGPRGGAL
jgi:hypothetical protein